jgi:hypothetical protein
MRTSFRWLTGGLCITSIVCLAAFWHPSVSAQDRFTWQDTGRTAKGNSPPTKNNDSVRYGGNCQAASDDGKWCASIVEVVVTIPDDPNQFYRLKYFQETPENCTKAVRISSGPVGWASTVDCHFDPTLHRFVLHEKGWTKPQTFTSEIMIQERVGN